MCLKALSGNNIRASGFKVTDQKGYVTIDHIGTAVKLVDRLEFSTANFSPEILKGWQR